MKHRPLALAGLICILSLLAGCASQHTEPLGETPANPILAAMQLPATRPTLQSGVYNWDQMQKQTTNIGERRQVERQRTATLDELEMHITTLNAGEPSHPAHRHANEELIMVKEGTMEAVINDKPYPMPTGSILFVAPNDLHFVRNVGKTQATYFVVSWRTPMTGRTSN